MKLSFMVWTILLVGTLPLGSLLNSASAQQIQGPRKGGTLVVVLPLIPSTLNPGITIGNTNHFIAAPVFNSLLETRTMDLKLSPGLAERWDASPDAKTFTFYLVKNATWHDGRKFTSADVKFTFEEIIVKYHPDGKPNFGAIQSIDTPDNYTVRFNLNRPGPSFLVMASSTYQAPILPKHLYEGTDILNNPYNWKPVGTGSFRFVQYVQQDSVTLERNPNYWRTNKPYLDKIIFKIIPSQETQVQAIQKGEVDLMLHYTTPASYKTLSGVPGIVAAMAPSVTPVVTFLYFNLDHPILKTLKVRQAIAHAIDRNKIAQVALEGLGPPGVGPISDLISWAYDPNLQPSYPYDVTKANQLLDEAGYPRQTGGIRFKLGLSDQPGLNYNKHAEMVKDMLSQVGIDVDHQLIASPTGDQVVFVQRRFDLAVRWVSEAPDPSIPMTTSFGSAMVGKGTSSNCMNYQNPEADALLAKVQVEPDPVTRRNLILQWQKMIMTDLPVYTLTYDRYPMVYRNEFVIPQNPWRFHTMFAENIWWTKGTLIETPKTTTTTTTSVPAAPAPDLTLVTGAMVTVVIVAIAAVYAYRKKNLSKSK
jgi:peptide/nickel transport system substrate-binding protein